MWWFQRPEEPPDGLPPHYALFQGEEGWFFVRNAHGLEAKEGPFPEREDARYWAWKDLERRP